MSRHFYITTPIYYVNDVPHIGHMYTTVAADVVSRYKRMCGVNTYFLTGTDEHGQKIQQAAQKKGVSPQELADSVVERYHKLWSAINITNNRFIRTTDPEHIQAVQKIFSQLRESGDIYEGDYEGWYCTPCEAFWTETQLAVGQLCPDCGRATSRMKEPTYFFRMSKYQDRLLKHIEENPSFIAPESRRNEILSFVREGLRDLSVSRTSFSWGIKVPGDPKHVIYVWIDALANYITAMGYNSDDETLYNRFWPADFHLVGKDIVRFHTVYWPTLLMALGLPLPKTVFAHGWWTVEGQKMSKSLGNVVNPFHLIEMFGVDQVRYFLLREVTFGLDGDFSYKALIHRINSDLSNDLGNLATRSFGMIARYFSGVIPAPKGSTTAEDEIKKLIGHTASQYCAYFEELAFNKVLLSVWTLVSAMNKYIDEMQPWALVKEESGKDRLSTVLYTVADGLRAISHFIAPFMPTSAETLRLQLGLGKDVCVKDEHSLADAYVLKPGGTLGEITALFPRVDEKEFMAKIHAESAKNDAKLNDTATSGKDAISIEEFAKVLLIAGRIEAAEKVQKSDKLLKLAVNDGSGIRTIVSGIAKSYPPEALIGKTVAIVANLKPAKLMGIESNGMVLAAFDGVKHHVMLLPDNIAPGTVVK